MDGDGVGLISETWPAGLPQLASPLPDGWSSLPPEPPERIGEYRRVRKLGQGGMGQVYLYEDTTLSRLVAVKFLGTGDLARPGQRERFLVEAQAIARLSHPHVVAVHRAGEAEGRPFLVSEFVRGRALSEVPMPMPWPEALRIGLELARGLAAAHRQGVLHRDIKPANVMMDEEGHVKLCDFGLAKLVHGPGAGPAEAAGAADPGTALSPLTQAGAILGTPAYMSPEAWRGMPATPQMDIYSLGVLLYELCAGRPLYLSPSTPALCVAAQTQDPPPLRSLAPRVDAGLAAVIHRCVARDPSARYASAVDLGAALAGLLHRRRRVRWYLAAAAVGMVLVLAAGARWAVLRAQRTGMAVIPGGTFRMGSTPEEVDAAFRFCQGERPGCQKATYEREMPARQVRVSSFRLDRAEVTNEHFAAWLERQPGLEVRDDTEPPPIPRRYVYEGATLLADLNPKRSGIAYRDGHFRVRPGAADLPVAQVTWDGARRYCETHGQRLPTEAEWEFAARGPGPARFPWGDDVPGCADMIFGRTPGHACASSGQGPAEVGGARLDRTRQGVLDLGGNVSEWVADRFVEHYAPCAGVCQDPRVDAPGGPVERVVRGGSWYLPASAGRAAARSHFAQDVPAFNIGFRCAASLPAR